MLRGVSATGGYDMIGHDLSCISSRRVLRRLEFLCLACLFFFSGRLAHLTYSTCIVPYIHTYMPYLLCLPCFRLTLTGRQSPVASDGADQSPLPSTCFPALPSSSNHNACAIMHLGLIVANGRERSENSSRSKARVCNPS
jgi:hypothetical protein